MPATPSAATPNRVRATAAPAVFSGDDCESVAEWVDEAVDRLRRHNAERLLAQFDATADVVAASAAAAPERDQLLDLHGDAKALADYDALVAALSTADEPAIGEDPLTGALAAHAAQGCALTGVRIEQVEALQLRSGTIADCVADASATATADGAALVGPGRHSDRPAAFRLAPGQLGADVALTVRIRNILGLTRPFVPISVRVLVMAGLGADRVHVLRISDAAFAFARDLGPGDEAVIALNGGGLLDALPCPLGLVLGAWAIIDLPVGVPAPRPRGQGATTRRFRRLGTGKITTLAAA
jgi:hypothetical protein